MTKKNYSTAADIKRKLLDTLDEASKNFVQPDVNAQRELLLDFLSFYAKKYQMTFTDKFKQELIQEFEKSDNSQ